MDRADALPIILSGSELPLESDRHSADTLVLQVWDEPEGGFTVTVPALPGCVTYGKTVAEAQFMAADAISCYLASVKKHERDSYTTPSNILLTTVTV